MGIYPYRSRSKFSKLNTCRFRSRSTRELTRDVPYQPLKACRFFFLASSLSLAQFHSLCLLPFLYSTTEADAMGVFGLVFKGLVYRTEKKNRNRTELDRLGPDCQLWLHTFQIDRPWLQELQGGP